MGVFAVEFPFFLSIHGYEHTLYTHTLELFCCFTVRFCGMVLFSVSLSFYLFTFFVAVAVAAHLTHDFIGFFIYYWFSRLSCLPTTTTPLIISRIFSLFYPSVPAHPHPHPPLLPFSLPLISLSSFFSSHLSISPSLSLHLSLLSLFFFFSTNILLSVLIVAFPAVVFSDYNPSCACIFTSLPPPPSPSPSTACYR